MSERIAATLDGQGLWAFKKLKRLLGKNDSQALQWLIDQWVRVDKEFVEEHGLGISDYVHETRGVVEFPGSGSRTAD